MSAKIFQLNLLLLTLLCFSSCHSSATSINALDQTNNSQLQSVQITATPERKNENLFDSYDRKSNQKQTSLEEVDANQAKWKEKQIVDYSFVLRADCLCSLAPKSPVIIQVRNDKISKIEPTDESKSNGFRLYLDSYKNHNTIDKLFDEIRQALKNKAAVVSVAYDRELGYPKAVGIDRDKAFVDDELSFWVENFQVTK